MAEGPAKKRRYGSIVLSLACIGVACAVGWSLFGKRLESQASAGRGAVTGSIGMEVARPVGASGFPIPRFVSLKAEKVNVRRGPSSDHPVAWVFQRKGLPVEIVAEFENWRRVRDSDGEEGWILQNMLAGRRTAEIAPWKKGQNVTLLQSPRNGAGMVAKVGSGVVAEVENCDGDWCELSAGGYSGFVEQTQLWGVYPGEKVN
ncbi:SH3 domain-containing protein [Aestuariivirga sp.]|uniref:SH3 domain-containing protein n=1 Tax=Aestuariivirga sp. TaxID=2650926 RepID=UPI0025C18FCA|nr:SH3 domain-containing protein [Aestuariivirga sp.]